VSIGEEPDEGKLQVRFCEGHCESLTLIDRNFINERERFRYVYSTKIQFGEVNV
jgi:hypothetical protein